MDSLELRNALLRNLHFTETASAPASAKEDIATAITRAFQDIFTMGPVFFRRTTITISTVASTQTVTLPANVQEVLEPVSIGLSDLTKLHSRGDLTQWSARFNGALTHATEEDQPMAYYLERTNISGDVAENAQVEIAFAPTPDAIYSVDLKVAIEAPSFTRENFCEDPTPELPIPHQYVESLLLPVAKYHLQESNYFTDYAKSPQFERGYAQAFMALGIADPIVPPINFDKSKHPKPA